MPDPGGVARLISATARRDRLQERAEEGEAEVALLRARIADLEGRAVAATTAADSHLSRDERRAVLARLVRHPDTPPAAAARLIELDAELAGEVVPDVGTDAGTLGRGAAAAMTDAELLAFVEGGGGG